MAGQPATFWKQTENWVKKSASYSAVSGSPSNPALSSSPYPYGHTFGPSSLPGNPCWDPPLTRCWMEHLNSGIARFAPVFFNSLFTAADENLPLSMVRVKNKPQHLVFCSHFPHQPFKHRHSPVETSNQPCLARVCPVKFAPNSGQQQGGSNVPISQFDPCPNPSPAGTPAQDAEPVHFRGSSVQVVDIWTALRARSRLDSRLARDHLLVQDSHDQNPVRLGKVEDHMLPKLKTSKTGPNGIASPTEGRVLCQQFKAIEKTSRISSCLVRSPCLHGVTDSGPEIRFSKSC